VIVDRDKKHLEEHFQHCYPSLRGLCCEMHFEDCDIPNKDFFDLLKSEKYGEMDYIVIALNSNEANKRVALDIQLYYQRNNLTLPHIAVSEKNGGLHEKHQTGDTFIFGCRDEIYKDSVIIRDEHNNRAKAVHEMYRKLFGGKPWHELDWFLQESNRASADFIPAMLYLAKNPDKDPDRLGFSDEEAMKLDKLTTNPAHIEILAKTEHLRWNAFHTAMGYQSITIEKMRERYEMYDTNRCEFARRCSVKKLQVCLASWEALDGITTAYRDLALRTGNAKEQKRDFKNNDLEIVENIPKFLREGKTQGDN